MINYVFHSRALTDRLHDGGGKAHDGAPHGGDDVAEHDDLHSLGAVGSGSERQSTFGLLRLRRSRLPEVVLPPAQDDAIALKGARVEATGRDRGECPDGGVTLSAPVLAEAEDVALRRQGATMSATTTRILENPRRRGTDSALRRSPTAERASFV